MEMKIRRHKGTKAQREKRNRKGKNYTLYPIPYTLHPTPYTLILTVVCCLLLLAGCGGGSSNPLVSGTLTVSAQNSSGGSVSAKILLNNVAKGNAPLQITDLAPGTYTLLLQSAGYADYTSSVVVQSGQTTTVTAAMQTVSVPDGPTFTKQ